MVPGLTSPRVSMYNQRVITQDNIERCDEMFGKRSDGWLVKDIDPIIALTPYLMPMRCDAQVMLKYNTDYEKLARYIVKKNGEGYKISFMDIVIAAYVRTVAMLPEINRFIANKRIYARKEIAVSFVVLKNTNDDSVRENTVKTKFDPHDTIYDVAARIERDIAISRQENADNLTLKVANILRLPIFANTVVFLARMLDRYGILPRIIMEASPFHTGMFITNMASIGMPAVNHHIYNFGTTSLFVSIGTNERSVEMDRDGTPRRVRHMPIGVVADERVCAGMIYSRMVASMMNLIKNPELLENPPDMVEFDEGHAYALPAIKIKKRRFHRFSRKKRQLQESVIEEMQKAQ